MANPANPQNLNPITPVTPVTPEPLVYAFSSGNAFRAFTKFNGQNFFTWRQNMETQLHVLGQWEVVDGTVQAPIPAIANQPTPDEVQEANAWRLCVAQAYAKIALCLEDEYSEMITMTSDPHTAWTMLETSYGAQQTGIQSVINAELTLTKWNGHTPITAHWDHMKTLCTCLASAGLAITPMQCFNHFINTLPAEYDMVIA